MSWTVRIQLCPSASARTVPRGGSKASLPGFSMTFDAGDVNLELVVDPTDTGIHPEPLGFVMGPQCHMALPFRSKGKASPESKAVRMRMYAISLTV